jgi:hypothetical protein
MKETITSVMPGVYYARQRGDKRKGKDCTKNMTVGLGEGDAEALRFIAEWAREPSVSKMLQNLARGRYMLVERE